MSARLLSVLSAIILLVNISAYGQDIIHTQKLSTSVIIDGIVSDEEWKHVTPLHITQKVPDAGAAPTQKTEIRIAYDQDYLYLSGRLYDSEPSKIIANTKKRDHFTENTEWVGLLIDSYNDRKNALAFFVTPNGAKLDMALANDVQGPSAFNTSWNALWDVKTIRNDEGWFAEMRIPFSSLSFKEENGQVVMGITTFRYLARNDETDIFPPRDLSTGSTFRPSLTQRFRFEDVSTKKIIQLTPYVLGGQSIQSNSTNRFTESISSTKSEVGLDVRLPINDKIHVDLTYNTDFAQVEADDQQINLSRSSLFFPEKRLFFQERASLFDFNFGGNDKLFHSRQIGIVNGQQAKIIGGIRAVGKIGNWDNGLIALKTKASDGLPSENFLVYRLKNKVFNEKSNFGIMYTMRNSASNPSGSALGIDSDIHLGKDVFFNLRYTQSRNRSQINEDWKKGNKFYIQLVKLSQLGFTYNFDVEGSSEYYQPLVGFQARGNFLKVGSRLSYNFFPKNSSKVVQHGPYMNSAVIKTNSTGALESVYSRGGYNLTTAKGYSFDINVDHSYENILQPISFTQSSIISPGSYSFATANISVTSPAAGRISYAINSSLGSFYNGKRYSVYVQPTVSISPDLSLGLTYQFNNITLITSDEASKSEQLNILKLDGLYTISTKVSLGINVQYNSLSSSLISGVRFRYNPREGNDLYIVYNSAEDMHDKVYESLLSQRRLQTVLIKYSHTFRL